MTQNTKKPIDLKHFDTYIEYAKILRTWLVAYGIGAPALILTNEKITANLLDKPSIKCFAMAFLAGVILQVFLASLNKIIMWCCYYGEEVDPDFQETKRFKVAYYISSQFWIDIVIDVSTMLAFGYATFGLLNLLLP